MADHPRNGYDAHTKVGRVLSNPAASEAMLRHVAELEGIGTTALNLVKGMSLEQLAGYTDGVWLAPLLAELALLPSPGENELGPEEPRYDDDYEDNSVPMGSAQMDAPTTTPRW